MDRRGFIGSIIGTVAGLAFAARLPTEPWQRVIKPYRMAFKDSQTGFIIQAPGIQAIEKVPTGYKFIAEKLNVTRTMTINQVVLFKPDGQHVRTTNFDSPVFMMNGDALSVTQTLNLDLENNLSVDGLIDLFIKYPNGDIPKDLVYGPGKA